MIAAPAGAGEPPANRWATTSILRIAFRAARTGAILQRPYFPSVDPVARRASTVCAAVERPTVGGIDLPLAGGAPAGRQLRRSLVQKRRQVSAVLGQQRERALASERHAVAGDHMPGAGDERLEPRQRLEVGPRAAARPDHRDLDRAEVVAAHERAAPGQPERGALAGVPGSWVELELAPAAQLKPPRHRERLHARKRKGPLALDVVALVEPAQLARGRARRGGQPPRGLLARAERGLREGEPAEQMVPVAMGDEEPGDREGRPLQDVGQRFKLVRVDRRVDQEALLAAAYGHAARLPDAADEHDQVIRERERAHAVLADAQQLHSLAQVCDLGVGLLLTRLKLLLAAVDPNHGDLALEARLDVVVVAGGDVHPPFLAADPSLTFDEVGGVRLVGAHLLGSHDEVEVERDVAAGLAEQLVVDV